MDHCNDQITSLPQPSKAQKSPENGLDLKVQRHQDSLFLLQFEALALKIKLEKPHYLYRQSLLNPQHGRTRGYVLVTHHVRSTLRSDFREQPN